VFGHKLAYFVKHETKGKKCCTEDEVINMSTHLVLDYKPTRYHPPRSHYFGTNIGKL